MNTTPKITVASDKTFTFTLQISLEEINSQKQHVLQDLAKDFESKGFRKGKAPLNVVESHLSPDKLLEETANSLLSEKYRQVVTDSSLKPATSPLIKIKNPPFELNKAWEIEITGAQIPDVTVDPKAFTEIKDAIAKETDKSKKTDLALKILLGHTTAKLAQLIIDNDVSQKLSRLVDQTQQAGITVDSYLKSKNLTLEQYRHQLEHQVVDEWTLNLAINQIATEQKLEPTPAEIKEVLAKNSGLSQNPDLVFFLLTQQKVIDYLLSL